jgi:hypothetical protein
VTTVTTATNQEHVATSARKSVAILHEICTPQQPPRLMTIPCIVVRPKSSDNSFISIEDGISSVVKAVVEEGYYVIEGYSLQIRSEGDDTNVIF